MCFCCRCCSTIIPCHSSWSNAEHNDQLIRCILATLNDNVGRLLYCIAVASCVQETTQTKDPVNYCALNTIATVISFVLEKLCTSYFLFSKISNVASRVKSYLFIDV